MANDCILCLVGKLFPHLGGNRHTRTGTDVHCALAQMFSEVPYCSLTPESKQKRGACLKVGMNLEAAISNGWTGRLPAVSGPAVPTAHTTQSHRPHRQDGV